MDDILKKALLHALGTATYVVLLVSFIFSLQTFHEEPDTIIIPMAMILLFICSAAITGFLVFGKPIMWYIDGQKKEAMLLLGYTLGILFMITILFFTSLILYYYVFT